MAQEITVQLEDEAARALKRLQALGLSASQAVCGALVEMSERMSDKVALAAEVTALATDPDDRAEMLAITDLIELLLVPR